MLSYAISRNAFILDRTPGQRTISPDIAQIYEGIKLLPVTMKELKVLR